MRPGILSAALLAFVLTGCFPYSCNRTESRALLPADSLARVTAAAMPVDTLRVQELPEIPPMDYPRTLGFAPDGTLWVTDTGDHQLIALGSEAPRVVRLDSLRFPYLVGFRGGQPVVFSPEAARIVSLDGALSVGTPPELPPQALQYAAVTDSVLWYKVAGLGLASRLVKLEPDGRETDEIALPDPYWRWAGALRLHNNEPVSLSGYRPQVYGFSGGAIDSTVLRGFDSPMLSRSRGFLTGQISQPPLLTSSAAFLGDDLYVLNVRPGWLRVDVFDAGLNLRRILVEPDPGFGKEFFPTDIAVSRHGDDVLIAISLTQPEAKVRLYRAEGQ